MNNNYWQQNRGRLLVAGLLTIALLVCLIIGSSRPNAYSIDSVTFPPLTNGELLLNWIPTSSYNYTIDRISDYLKLNHITAATVSIHNAINPQNDSYAFNILIQPQGTVVPVNVTVANTNSVISTTVSIDGVVQSPPIPAVSQHYHGVTALINAGMTISQATSLQNALKQFNAQASTFTVDPASISRQTDPRTEVVYYTFSFTADASKYTAQVHLYDSSSIDLTVFDPQSQLAVFDSGVVDNPSGVIDNTN